jgi:ankyrin repeat protein
LHLGLCTEEAFLHFARDFDFEASLLCFSQDFEHRPVSAAWESVCRCGINVPEGCADSAAPAIPLRRRLELLLKDGRAGTDPLHWAANNCPEALDVLLSGPEPLINIDAPSQASGTTALMASAFAGKLESVQKLIGHGADPRRTNRTGMTALHAVCFGPADPQITTAILDAAKQKIANSGTPQDKHEEALSRFVNQADQNGDGALKLLFYADSHENSVETAALLLGAGAKLNAYHNTQETALHFGARNFGPQPGNGDYDPRHNNMPLLQYLVSKFQTAGLIDKPDGEGYTALFRAAHVERTEAVTLLIKAGAVGIGGEKRR